MSNRARVAPIRLPVWPNLTVPTSVPVTDGCAPLVTSWTVSPSWKPPVAADFSSITSSSGPLGGAALGDGDDRRAVGGRRVVEVPADAGGTAAAAEDLAVLADDVGALVADGAVGPGDPVERRDVVGDGGRHRPGIAAGESAGRRGRRLRRPDRHVGRGLREQLAEAAAQGVGEDQRAGDERDAEHDGEGTHAHPQLVREQALQGGPEHLSDPRRWTAGAGAGRRSPSSGRAPGPPSAPSSRRRCDRRPGTAPGPHSRRRPGRG